jgi:hypothetical protein
MLLSQTQRMLCPKTSLPLIFETVNTHAFNLLPTKSSVLERLVLGGWVAASCLGNITLTESQQGHYEKYPQTYQFHSHESLECSKLIFLFWGMIRRRSVCRKNHGKKIKLEIDGQ